MLKASKIRELVFKKQVELEEIYRGVHIDVDSDAARQILNSLIDSGLPRSYFSISRNLITAWTVQICMSSFHQCFLPLSFLFSSGSFSLLHCSEKLAPFVIPFFLFIYLFIFLNYSS